MVEQVAAEFEGQPAMRGRLETLLEGEGAMVQADREAPGRALWNLLDNAAQYSPDSAPILLELASRAKKVIIRGRDHGAGIPTGEQKEIFRKFCRGSAARKSGVKGTGIGLATVRHIVHAHRGDVTVGSTRIVEARPLWSSVLTRDGKTLLFSKEKENALMALDTRRGVEKQVASFPKEVWVRPFALSPDERTMAFVAQHEKVENGRRFIAGVALKLMDLGRSQSRVVARYDKEEFVKAPGFLRRLSTL